jgi:hypothetical protein
MLSLVAASALAAAPVRLDRVDLLNEEAPTFLHYDVPMGRAYGMATALRFVEQLKVVVALPVDGLYAGASLTSQSLAWEGPLWRSADGRGLFWSAGLSTRLLMPYGVQGGVAWRFGLLRVGLSLQAASAASWARPAWSEWRVLPALGVGLGPNVAPGL